MLNLCINCSHFHYEKNPNQSIKANVNTYIIKYSQRIQDLSRNIHWLFVSSILTSAVCSILFDSPSEGELGRTLLGMKSNLCKVEIMKLNN